MSEQQLTVKSFLETVLDKNEHIDKHLVEKQAVLEQALKNLGVITAPSFGIDAPLSQNNFTFNRSIK